MLYMNIVTWEPPQRDAVVKRFTTMGLGLPAKFKLLGIWGDICGGRIFQLVDTGDVRDLKVAFQTNYAWNDLCKIESVTVMAPEEMVKNIPRK
jgi:hypothetical protein